MSDAPARQLDPVPVFLRDAALQAVLAALPDARLVGGAVRDAVAGRQVADIDLATPSPPHEVLDALAKAAIRAIPTGLDHGTITAAIGGRSFEITSLRCDEETDGRHARVAFTRDWREDAARRDFTINAMSMREDGAVFDYFDGLADLAAGRVRFVGDPATRIAEDYLRILRFFRFFARYAAGPPDRDAIAAIRAALPGIARLSAERVWSELRRILAAPDPVQALRLMAELGVLDAVIPEGAAADRLASLIAGGAPPDPILRLAALLTGDAVAFADRLKLSGAERDRLLLLRAGPAPNGDTDDAQLRRLLADTPPDILIGRAWLAAPEDAATRSRISAIPPPVFPLEGRDALALGMAPGPAVGVALRAVRDWWLAGGCIVDAAGCRAELARLLAG